MHGDEKYRGVRRLRPFSARCEHQFSTCRQTKFSHTSHTILVFDLLLVTSTLALVETKFSHTSHTILVFALLLLTSTLVLVVLELL